ncbi:MAG: SemiSWEET transporter [Alphaproteobacteria bacterium]|nr:SemiSWEET transporter [Alphaproteobacteria bacterium]
METELIGSVAAALTTLSFLPQVIKTWNSRSAADLSWIWLIGFSAGLSLWLVYGFALMSWPLIAANGITLSLVLLITYVKWRESR